MMRVAGWVHPRRCFKDTMMMHSLRFRPFRARERCLASFFGGEHTLLSFDRLRTGPGRRKGCNNLCAIVQQPRHRIEEGGKIEGTGPFAVGRGLFTPLAAGVSRNEDIGEGRKSYYGVSLPFFLHL